MNISDRMLRMKVSATLAMTDKAEELKSQGKKVISLTSGEPDFSSPEAALEYALQAMRTDRTHYTTSVGFKELRQAISDYYRQYHGVDYTLKEILVGSGAKPLLFEAFGTLVNPGDEVIVPVPAWVSYVEQVDVFDGKSILLDTSENDFMLDLVAIENAITARSRVIVINSPNNPTGVVYPRELMAQLCRLAMQYNLIVINDEIYERQTYGVRYVNPLADVPEAKDFVLTINGVSKAYAMTGWRIGFALGPYKLISKMAVMQGHITTCASSVSQWAALGAILHAQKEVDVMQEQYRQRMEFVYAELAAMPHIRVKKPTGAFYMYIDIRGCYGKSCQGTVISDDSVFCQLLMENALVALVPGVAFMGPGFARLSYATNMDSLRQAMASMRVFLEKLL